MPGGGALRAPGKHLRCLGEPLRGGGSATRVAFPGKGSLSFRSHPFSSELHFPSDAVTYWLVFYGLKGIPWCKCSLGD